MNRRLLVALDFPTATEAEGVVERLGELGGAYKIGMELFAAEGPALVRRLVGAGKLVFLDLKLHEIPHSVASAVRVAGGLGVGMVTVHASGGRRMMEAAVQAAQGYDGLRVLALTVVSSLGDEELAEVGVPGGRAGQAVRLAELAEDCGCHGLVASAAEVGELRRTVGDGMLLVTPGIRPAGGPAAQDHGRRAATPGEAMRAGATHLIVGRPITRAGDPRAVARQVLDDMR